VTFSPAILLKQLQRFPQARGYHVAYSGGMDSHVLLHALAALRDALGVPVGAVHVNHGLQAHAADWQEHCAMVCRQLDVEYVALCVDARAASGESPEAAARTARYAALADWLPDQHCLLTAHHQDDQAETLLVQLLRGSGVQGLAAMPAQSVLGQGMHLRPLLDCPRAGLESYADVQGLNWIEDPSNRDTGFTRNFLRHRVMPELQRRWPGSSASLARSAAHQAEAAALLDELATADLERLSGPDASLSRTGLDTLSSRRQRNVLRFWIRRQAGGSPSSAVLARIQQDVLHSREDAQPCVRWGGFELRRYRDRLYVLKQEVTPFSGQELGWSLEAPLFVPQAGGVLSASTCIGQGIRVSALGASGVRVGWRRGGERCVPAGRGQHHSLKKLFQEQGIPPWQRTRIPLIYIEGELAAVAGLWVCEPYQAGPSEPGLKIQWRQAVPAEEFCPIDPRE
jgi:tRNA(Ile)-lysidine synthase